jgi:N4-gp56 family major capsid protein
MATASDFEGNIYSTGLPAWQRDYYESVLLETLRTKSILVPFTKVVEDFTAVDTGTIHFSEVLDLEPNWNATSESTIWKKGMFLDSRTQNIGLSWYHDIIKYSDHLETLAYLNNGDTKGIVRNKLGVAMTDMLDILAMNAHLTHPNPTYAGDATSRATLGDGVPADTFDVDQCEEIRTQLEEANVPGVVSTEDGGSQTILCITTPRVIHDIRVNNENDWLDVQNYQGTGAKFRSEAGMWGGVRFIKTNRLKLWNRGLATQQTTLNADSVEGQGASATVDTIYTPGQAGSTRYVEVTSSTGFSADDVVTIHAQGLGTTVTDGDGGQETRRIVEVVSPTRISFDKPLLKAHTSGDYVTLAANVHASLFMGGPGIVMGIAERPNVIVPPKYDDALLINRIGWRGMLKFQLFSPELFRVYYSLGSVE